MPIEFAVVDIAMVVVLLASAAVGLMRGFVKEVVSLVIWGAALFLGLAFGRPLGEFIALDLGPKLPTVVGFLTVFVAVLIVGAIVQRLLRGLVQSAGLSGSDRTLGLVFGAVRGLAVVVVGLIAIRPFAEEQAWWQESRFAPAVLTFESEVLAAADALMGVLGEGEPTSIVNEGAS